MKKLYLKVPLNSILLNESEPDEDSISLEFNIDTNEFKLNSNIYDLNKIYNKLFIHKDEVSVLDIIINHDDSGSSFEVYEYKNEIELELENYDVSNKYVFDYKDDTQFITYLNSIKNKHFKYIKITDTARFTAGKFENTNLYNYEFPLNVEIYALYETSLISEYQEYEKSIYKKINIVEVYCGNNAQDEGNSNFYFYDDKNFYEIYYKNEIYNIRLYF